MMRFGTVLVGMLIVLASAVLGCYLDDYKGIDNPPLYWLIGSVGVALGMGVAMLGGIFSEE